MNNLTTQENIENLYKLLNKQGNTLEANQKNIEMLILTLKGSDEYGTYGYKDRILSNEDNIEQMKGNINEQEKRFNNIYNKIIGICIGVSIATSSIGFLIKNSIVKTKANPIERVESIETYPINNPAYPDITSDLKSYAIRDERDSLKTKNKIQ